MAEKSIFTAPPNCMDWNTLGKSGGIIVLTFSSTNINLVIVRVSLARFLFKCFLLNLGIWAIQLYNFPNIQVQINPPEFEMKEISISLKF